MANRQSRLHVKTGTRACLQDRCLRTPAFTALVTLLLLLFQTLSALAMLTPASAVYLPPVFRMPTPTPTVTPTATATFTPLPTPTPTRTPLVTNDLRISHIQYSGKDEYVKVSNCGPSSQLMTGWKIHSVVGDQWYTFPYGYTLAAATDVCVHSGPEATDNPPAHLKWTTRYIWNNSGDEARLYDAQGGLRDTRAY